MKNLNKKSSKRFIQQDLKKQLKKIIIQEFLPLCHDAKINGNIKLTIPIFANCPDCKHLTQMSVSVEINGTNSGEKQNVH